MDKQEKKVKEPKFNTFLKSYITDILVFAAGIFNHDFNVYSHLFHLFVMLTVKIKPLVANVILHQAKTIEAANLKNNNCEPGIMKF